MSELEWLKDFLRNDTIYAFAAIELLTILILFRKLSKTQDERLADFKERLDEAKQVASLTEKFMIVVQNASRTRRRSPSSPELPSIDSGKQE